MSYLQSGSLCSRATRSSEKSGAADTAIVYRARDNELGAEVAIKLLVPPPAMASISPGSACVERCSPRDGSPTPTSWRCTTPPKRASGASW